MKILRIIAQLALVIAYLIVYQSAVYAEGVEPDLSGGTESKRGDHPWSVFLRIGRYSCGGTLIDREWVLTAAHCVDNNSEIVLHIGGIDKQTQEDGEVIVTAIGKHIPLTYDRKSSKDDLALVRIFPISETGYIQSIDIYTGTTGEVNRIVEITPTVAGWGRTEVISDTRYLRYITARYLCFITEERHLKCQDPYQPILGLCPGDSGTGAVIETIDGKKLLASSWGANSCTDDRRFSMFVLFTESNREWMGSIMAIPRIYVRIPYLYGRAIVSN